MFLLSSFCVPSHEYLFKVILKLYSLLTLKSVVIPTLLWILPEQCNQLRGQHLCNHTTAVATYSFLRSGLIEIFYVSAACYALGSFKVLIMLLCFRQICNNFSSLAHQFRVHFPPTLSYWRLALHRVAHEYWSLTNIGLLSFHKMYAWILGTSIGMIYRW